jgi:hypothetical protein
MEDYKDLIEHEMTIGMLFEAGISVPTNNQISHSSDLDPGDIVRIDLRYYIPTLMKDIDSISKSKLKDVTLSSHTGEVLINGKPSLSQSSGMHPTSNQPSKQGASSNKVSTLADFLKQLKSGNLEDALKNLDDSTKKSLIQAIQDAVTNQSTSNTSSQSSFTQQDIDSLDKNIEASVNVFKQKQTPIDNQVKNSLKTFAVNNFDKYRTPDEYLKAYKKENPKLVIQDPMFDNVIKNTWIALAGTNKYETVNEEDIGLLFEAYCILTDMRTLLEANGNNQSPQNNPQQLQQPQNNQQVQVQNPPKPAKKTTPKANPQQNMTIEELIKDPKNDNLPQVVILKKMMKMRDELKNIQGSTTGELVGEVIEAIPASEAQSGQHGYNIDSVKVALYKRVKTKNGEAGYEKQGNEVIIPFMSIKSRVPQQKKPNWFQKMFT